MVIVLNCFESEIHLFYHKKTGLRYHLFSLRDHIIMTSTTTTMKLPLLTYKMVEYLIYTFHQIGVFFLH